MDNTFSIVIPAYNSEKTIARAIQSCISQAYSRWELLIVNDGSSDDTQKIASEFMRRERRIKMFVISNNEGRAVARNMGMRMARNDWICWLDADDEYMGNYLEVLNDEINRDPSYDIFNFATFVKEREIIDGIRYEKGYKIRETFKPAIRPDKKGHESFSSGNIGTGSFIFKRSLIKKIGYFPETKIPYGSDQSFPALWVKKDPAMAEICKQNEDGDWLPLGNPWGDDYSYFWRLTRNHLSKPLDVCLYINHIRD